MFWAWPNGVGEVLQASTSEIYGDPDVHPQPESYRGLVNTLGPRVLRRRKRAAEALCSDYRRSHDVEVRIARIFNTYGPGMATNDGRVVPISFCRRFGENR